MAFNINLHRFLSDQETVDTPLLAAAAGDTIDFSFATLSGFLGGSDLPVTGYLSVLVNGVELSQFIGADTGSNSTPPGSEAGTDFLYRQGTFSFSEVDPNTGKITLTYADPLGGSGQFLIAGDSSITLSAHLQDRGDTGSSTPVSDPDIAAINLIVDNPARGSLSQPEQVKLGMTDSLHATASDFNTLATGFTALSTALGANDSSSLITLLGDDLAISIAPQFGDVNAAIQTILARAEAGQSEPQTDVLVLSLVAMIDNAAAVMLDTIGSEAADAAYAETFVAPDWNLPAISGASPEANALLASSYTVLQDCAEMLTAAQRYQGAVLAGDAPAQAVQDLAFNTAFAQYNQDRVTVSAAIDAFLSSVADVTFEDDTTLADAQAYLAGLTDPTTEDPVLSAWISAITEAFPGLAAPLPSL